MSTGQDEDTSTGRQRTKHPTHQVMACFLRDAVAKDDTTEVFKLISAGADVCAPLPDDAVLLQFAASAHMVHMLVDFEADPNDGNPIFDHVRNVPVFKALIQRGANIGARLSTDETVLDVAIATNDSFVVRAVLECAASSGARLGSSTAPFVYAALFGATNVVALLVEFGYDVDEKFQGYTALHQAVHSNDEDMVGALLQLGADPFAQDENDVSPICYAALRSTSHMVAKFLMHNVDFDAGEFRPLVDACDGGNVDVVRFLLEHGANPNVRDTAGDGSSCLRVAEQTVHGLEIAQLLYAHGARDESMLVGPGAVRTWLREVQTWSTHLHFAHWLPEATVLALLRAGVDPNEGSPSAADVAKQFPDDIRARHVIRAAAPWSPETHHLFGPRTRRQAWAFARAGALMARERSGTDFGDIWTSAMSLIVTRDLERPH